MDGLRLKMTIHPFCDRFGLATVPIQVQDLLNYTTIDPMVQRKLSGGQRRKIANYLQERELDRVFFGPVTLSLRDVASLAKTEEGLSLRPGSKLSILDGQHRILALGYVNEQMLKESRRLERKLSGLKVKVRRNPEDTEAATELELLEGQIEQLERRRLELMESELAVQIYIGLSEEEEKQLFGDINSKVQLVSKELGHSFDSIDPLNLVIQQVLEHNMFLKGAGVERRANLTAYNKNFTSFSWLYSTATMLFTGKMQPSYELARKIKKKIRPCISKFCISSTVRCFRLCRSSRACRNTARRARHAGEHRLVCTPVLIHRRSIYEKLDDMSAHLRRLRLDAGERTFDRTIRSAR